MMLHIRSTLTIIKKHYENWEYGWYHEQLSRKYDNLPRQRFKMLRFILDEIKTILYYKLYGTLACRWFGHGEHLHNEDWGGPESGGMSGYCDRCGIGWHHVLY